jgi:hypothetical protein
VVTISLLAFDRYGEAKRSVRSGLAERRPGKVAEQGRIGIIWRTGCGLVDSPGQRLLAST